VSVLAKGKSYGPQFDNTDNFILQLNSTQEIKIWENPEGKLPPFNSEDHELNESDLGEPLETISMRVGKVLYEYNKTKLISWDSNRSLKRRLFIFTTGICLFWSIVRSRLILFSKLGSKSRYVQR